MLSHVKFFSTATYYLKKLPQFWKAAIIEECTVSYFSTYILFFSTKFSIMLFFHLRYRKLTSNIENSNHSFEKQKSPPVIFPPLILLPIPTPYSIQILSKIKKTVNFKKTKKPLLKGGYNKTRNQIRIPDLKKSKLFFIQYIFFWLAYAKALIFSFFCWPSECSSI